MVTRLHKLSSEMPAGVFTGRQKMTRIFGACLALLFLVVVVISLSFTTFLRPSAGRLLRVISPSSRLLPRKAATGPGIEGVGGSGEEISCIRPLNNVWGASYVESQEFSSFAWPMVAQSSLRCHNNPMLKLCCKPVHQVLILLWTDKLFGIPFMPPSKNSILPFICCHGVQFSYTVDKSLLSSADIVEFHLREFDAVAKPPRTNDQQLWMIVNFEGQYQIDNAVGKQVNLWRTFTRSSDIFHPYSDVGECQCNHSLRAFPVPFEERKKSPLLVVVSNCTGP